jgi:hypothetical protein
MILAAWIKSRYVAHKLTAMSEGKAIVIQIASEEVRISSPYCFRGSKELMSATY